MEAIIDPTIKAMSVPIFNDIIEAVSDFGYSPRLGRPIEGKGKSSFRKCKAFRTSPHLSKVFGKNTKLLVVWWSKVSDGFVKSLNVPTVILCKGILPETWLIDVGLLGDSVLVGQFPKALEDCLGDECQAWAEKYSKSISDNNKSKRSQSILKPSVPDEFVFLPMQYTEDISIKKYCPVPYEVFFKKVARFCIAENLPLVIKHHPDIVNNPKERKWRTNEIKKVNNLISHCRKMGCNIIVSDGSIHWFCKKCTFVAGMNTIAHIDAIMNQCTSFHIGRSVFMNSNAVVNDENIERGLKKCLTMSKEERGKLKQYQKAMLYYLYNKYSVIKPENNLFFSEWNNVQKIKHIILMGQRV